MNNTKSTSKTISLGFTAMLGLISWAGPQLLMKYFSIENPVFASFEEKNLISGLLIHICMFATGVISGFKFPLIKPWLIGIAGVILIPFYTFFELLINLSTHNLWPLEFIFTYPYLAVIVILGALLGNFLNKKTQGTNGESKRRSTFITILSGLRMKRIIRTSIF